MLALAQIFDGIAMLPWFLLLVFVVHLMVFGTLAVRRREGYYLALVVTFALLTCSLGMRLFLPEINLGGQELSQWVRWAAWLAALVSISWGVGRFVRRRGSRRARS